MSVVILPNVTESYNKSGNLNRKDRLIEIIGILRDGTLHRAQDIAAHFGVSQRTLYRDMQTLVRSGVPVQGERGSGYQITAPVTLPPLNLSMAELEVLHLGLAVMTEATDPNLQAAARSLSAKIDTVLPEDQLSATTAWGLAIFPFADTAAGIRHIPVLRCAVRNKQKLRLIYTEQDGSEFESIIHPQKLDYWGRVWTCDIWCERSNSTRGLRVDRIKSITVLSAKDGFHRN